jgi:hypothetical protein
VADGSSDDGGLHLLRDVDRHRGKVNLPGERRKLDFWDLTVLIFRRWKIALPLLLLAIGGTVFVAFTAKPDYAMTSYVQLIPAKIGATDNPNVTLRNPWNQLGLNTLGQAAIYATQDQGFLEQLKKTNHTDNFTLTMTYPNPIVTVEVVGTTPSDARATTDLVVSRLRAAAESLQRNAGVGDADIIATQRLDAGQNLLPSRSKQKRAILAVAAAGLILTAGGTVGIDAIQRSRRRKRVAAETFGADDAPPPTTESASAVAGTNGSTNGSSGSNGSSKVPMARAGTGNPLNGEHADNALRAAPPESLERTAIIIKRTSSVVKPAPPKQQRRSPAATYRSANAQSAEDSGDEGTDQHGNTPAEGNGDAPADSSDVRTVLPSEWVGSENGSKSK